MARTALSTTDGRDNGDYRFRSNSGRESTRVSNILFTNEDVDVRPNFTLLGNHAISHAGTDSPESG